MRYLARRYTVEIDTGIRQFSNNICIEIRFDRIKNPVDRFQAPQSGGRGPDAFDVIHKGIQLFAGNFEEIVAFRQPPRFCRLDD